MPTQITLLLAAFLAHAQFSSAAARAPILDPHF
jgi:hypothetical protein